MPTSFQSRAAFRPQTDYRLLPMRFGRLAGDRYVVTNDVGEYVVVRRPDLQALVERRLDVESSSYRTLKAKNFLFDQTSRVALDLLALKYRSRAEALSCFTGLHMFVVTLRCTNSCRYCQVSRRSEDGSGFDMSVEHADRALEFAFRSPSPNIKIEFQGGEPLLNFPLIRHVVDQASNLNQKHAKQLGFVIASNLSLLNDETIQFARQYGVTFSTSLDGPQEIHDAQRPLRGGTSYRATVDAINRLQGELGPDSVSALMTTTRASLQHASAIVEEYVRQNLHSIFLRNLRPYGFAVHDGRNEEYRPSEWVEFYRQALKHILLLNGSGYPMREEYTSILLQKMFSPTGSRYVDLQSPGGIGLAAVAFNYDGNVYASDEGRMLAEMGDTSFRLGNLDADSFETMMTSESLLGLLADTMLEGIPQCSDCVFLPYCGADPVFHTVTQGDAVGHKARSALCEKQTQILQHLITVLEDEAEAREIMLGWL